jgi:hypothetical protein
VILAEDDSSQVVIDGFSDVLDKTTFDGVFVGNLSALALDTDGRIAALSDRSSLFVLDAGTRRPVSVTALADEDGRPLDPEGLVVDHDGTRLVSSEEPAIRRFTRDGRLLGEIPIPDELRLAPKGRATVNLTFEGLALRADGRTLVASMEGPLAGDDAGIVRFQTWHRVGVTRDFAIAAQHGYRVDPGLAISDLAESGDDRLLVLERGYTGSGNTVRVYVGDPHRATDVRAIPYLTGQEDVRLIGKTLLADIGDLPSLGAPAHQPQANPLLGNIEGMAVVGHAPDGRVRLLLVSDDNHSPTQITRLYSLTVRLPRRV